MTEPARREGGQALGQFDHRLMGEAGEHHVFERIELLAQCRLDARMTVAEQVDPPRTDGVQNSIAVKIVQPHTLGTAHRHQRHQLVVFHLCARVPARAQAARAHGVVARCAQARIRNRGSIFNSGVIFFGAASGLKATLPSSGASRRCSSAAIFSASAGMAGSM